MPTYDYVCTSCNFVAEDIQCRIDDRKIPTTEPCPECGELTVELAVSAPHIGDAMQLGRLNLPSSWTDKLSEMKTKHRRNTIKVPSPAKREF